MVEQVSNLKEQYGRKIGFSEANGNKLFKFYVENPNLQGVYIPRNSFREYVEVYNLYYAVKEEEAEKARIEAEQKEQTKRNKSELKKYGGRPVSATPLTVLAKPKSKKTYEELYTKYRDDKLVNTLIV